MNIELDNDKLIKEFEKECLEDVKKVDYYESQGVSLLIMALYNKKPGFAQWLIQNGAELNCFIDGTPLDAACYYGTPKLIRMVLEGTTSEYLEKSDPLNQSVYSGKIENLKELLKLGFDLNHKNKYGETPLSVAVESIEIVTDGFIDMDIKKQLRMLDFLIKHGAEVTEEVKNNLEWLYSLENNKGDTVFSYALKFGYNELITWFIENGADIYKENKNRETIFEMCLKAPEIDLVKLFKKIDTSRVNQSELLLKLLISNIPNKVEKLKQMFEIGFSVDALIKKDEETETPLLMYSLQMSLDAEIVNVILERGPDLNLKDSKGWSFFLESLINVIQPEEEENIKKHIFSKIMLNRDFDLLGIEIKKLISNEEINDVFDFSIFQERYEWFESFLHLFSEEELHLYKSKRLLRLMREGSGPDIIFRKS